MTRQDTLQAFTDAQHSHEKQMAKVQTLIDGGTVSDPTKRDEHECEFGKWIYDKELNIESIIGSQFYSDLELLHRKWHKEYTKIDDIFIANKKTGFFAKLTGASDISEMDMDKAKLYQSELKATTAELLSSLSTSYKRVNAMSYTKFDD